MTKKISARVILALKDALVNIYWRKKDLRQFIELTIENSIIVSTIDWTENTKYESISELIDRMVNRQDMYQNDLLMLIQETGNMSDFSHLEYWDDSEKKIKIAKEFVNKLRNETKGYFDAIDELKAAKKRSEDNKEKIQSSIAYHQKLDGLKNRFFEIASNSNQQQKGFEFEKFLNELFRFFDLDPKSSFKITGEQIDGSFTFDNTDYLLEAKWQEKPITASELYNFGGKISGKLKNTLGLYISLGAYSSDCTKTQNPATKSMILMDGSDLMQILEGRITLNNMLYIKRRHASQTGEIYYKLKGI
ncbi:restriction endonuclease [candidate division KSB1 bacterium]